MNRAAALAALALLARPAAAETLDDWPCAGCVTVVPSRTSGSAGRPPGLRSDEPSPAPAPAPLLVALHGDGGGVKPLVRAWKAACEEAGVILLAPRCPRELGCTSQSFWRWYAEGGHDPAWLGAQIDAVTARYPVDPTRVYATGYSGGATYLGWYVPEHATRFAAVAHVAGGAPYGGACPSCKVPLLFVLGATDPMITPYTAPLRRWYEGCGGHEIAWETLRGVTHESILDTLAAGKAAQILAWLLARPASCAAGGAADGGSTNGSPGVPPVSLDAGPLADGGAEDARALPALPSPPPAPSPPRLPAEAPGCACGRGGTGGAVALAWPLVAAGLLLGRKQGRAIRRRSR